MRGIAGWIGEVSDAWPTPSTSSGLIARERQRQTEVLVRAVEALPPEKQFVPIAQPHASSLYDELDGFKTFELPGRH
jgi:hypothetical protein